VGERKSHDKPRGKKGHKRSLLPSGGNVGTQEPKPPPHVHTREDELFYVLEGEFDVYVGKEAFKVEAGECVFLPRFKPHAFVIRSPRLHVLALFTPAGLEEVFRGMSTPAQRLELPTGAVTYSTGDLKQTAQRLSEYGARFLAPTEVAEQLPMYPKSLPSNAAKFTIHTRVRVSA